MSTSDNRKKGELFEKYIASLYEALNFHVSRNISLNGQQVDIIAERSFSGIGKIKTLVECKFLSNGSVSNQVIYEWAAYINAIPKDNFVVNGVIVSNKDFSKDAQAAAIATNITLLTQDQLESEVFQLKESYLRNIRFYESSDIFTTYLPLNAIDKTSKKYSDEIVDIGENILNRSYDDWSRTKFITVLADFGSGKTTLMQWLNYQYSKRYLQGKAPKPVYFELKYFFQYQDIDLYAVNTYRKLFQKDIPAELFWKSVHHGEFILLLDGFDEMSPQVDRQIRLRNFQMLSRLLLSRSNAIISCRSSYFISDDEFHKSVEEINNVNKAPQLDISKQRIERLIVKEKQTQALYQALIHKYTDDRPVKSESEKVNARSLVVEISELNKKQIDSYLRNFDGEFEEKCGATWEDVRDFCYKIYDIRDLLKKPILISMVKDTMLYMGKDFRKNNEVYDPSSLYETYTSANLQRDFAKGTSRQFMSTTQRKQFAEVIAFKMFQNNTLEVSLEQLYSLIIKHADIWGTVVSITDKTLLENIVSDVVLCTFIRRTESVQFKFIHKSFMEFFVARKLKNLILKNDLAILRETLISQEILYFIGCYSTAEQLLLGLLENEASNPGLHKAKRVMKRNFAIALMISKNEHSNLVIRDVEISETKFSSQLFSDCEITGVDFKNITMSDVHFKRCSSIKIKLINSTIDYVRFEKSNVSLEYSYLNAIKVNFSECASIRFAGENALFSDLDISKSNVSGLGTLNLENPTLYDTNFNFIDSTNQNFSKASLDTVNYSVGKGNAISFKDSEMKNSYISIRSREIHVVNSQLLNTDLVLTQIDKNLRGEINITSCIWQLCSCRFNGDVNYITNHFQNVVFTQDNEASRYLFKKNSFDDCNFICIRLSEISLKEFLKNKFQDCKGVVLVHSEFMNEINSFKKYGIFFIDQNRVKENEIEDFRLELETSLQSDILINQLFSKYNLKDLI